MCIRDRCHSGQKRIECKKSDADGIRLDTEETGVKGQHDKDSQDVFKRQLLYCAAVFLLGWAVTLVLKRIPLLRRLV